MHFCSCLQCTHPDILLSLTRRSREREYGMRQFNYRELFYNCDTGSVLPPYRPFSLCPHKAPLLIYPETVCTHLELNIAPQSHVPQTPQTAFHQITNLRDSDPLNNTQSNSKYRRGMSALCTVSLTHLLPSSPSLCLLRSPPEHLCLCRFLPNSKNQPR